MECLLNTLVQENEYASKTVSDWTSLVCVAFLRDAASSFSPWNQTTSTLLILLLVLGMVT